jgi:predicted ribosome quality control (RQC) complex YloA/Tae2 family protein
LLFECYAGTDLRLLVSGADSPRLHLTTHSFENPQTPPPFCMLLRKYLKNGYVISIEQPGYERLVFLQIKRGDVGSLCVELLGPRGNLILLQDQKILGSLRPGTAKRPLQRGQLYQAPPPQPKLSLLSLSKDALVDRLLAHPESELAKALQSSLEGIGPRFAQELAARAGLDATQKVHTLSDTETETLWHQIAELAAQVQRTLFAPHLYFEGEKPLDCTPFPFQSYGHLRPEPCPSISEALDRCTTAQQTQSWFERRAQALRSHVHAKLKKVTEALYQVKADLEKARDFEKYREEGDLLMASLGQGCKGLSEIEVDDFFTGRRRLIRLDPTLSPIENAQRKYERYKKLKRGAEKLAERRAGLTEEVRYLQTVETQLEQAEDEITLEAIAQELTEEGYLLRAAGPRKSEPPAGPREYLVQGYRLWVGRSSKQNDALVRSAGREDYWLHARDRPGSHVIIRNPGRHAVPREVLEKAAQLAAYFSKGRLAGKVPVTYTQVKFLRKPKGARPGLVLVLQEEGTLLVNPSADV